MAIHFMTCAAETALPAAKKLVLMCLADDADKETRVASCGMDAVRQWSGLGRSQALAVVAELVDLGYLVRKAAGRRGRYAEFVVFPAGCCALHGPVPGHVPTLNPVPAASAQVSPATTPQEGSGQPDPGPSSTENPQVQAQPVDDQQSGSGQPDPATATGSGKGPAEGPAAGGPLSYPPMEEPPNPPHGGGQPTWCPRHPDRPGPNCRACGTTPRQVAEVARRLDAARPRRECPLHRGQLADSCRSCAADRKAAV